MMKLVLVRHGESQWNLENKFTGWHDVDLSAKGMEEAKAAGQLLKAEGYDFDICFTSILKRAIHTLDTMLTEMDRVWLPVIKDYHLNERHYGALQGLNKAETAEKYGEEQVKIWRRSFDIKPPDNGRPCPCLYDRNTVDDFRFFHKIVRMPADDKIHAPVRMKKLSQLPVHVKADVREEDGQVRSGSAVIIADDADLLGRLFYIDEGADYLFAFGRRQHFLGKDTDKKDLKVV